MKWERDETEFGLGKGLSVFVSDGLWYGIDDNDGVFAAYFCGTHLGTRLSEEAAIADCYRHAEGLADAFRAFAKGGW